VAGFPATRGDVERWLSRVPVESLGLGPDELFYVPLLQLRLPRGGSAFVPDLILARLRDLLAGAGRGWGESFSPGRAYRFAGRGRYYAWLVRLWIEGGQAARSAFEAATGQAALGPWQRRTVLRQAPDLVATIARLAETGHGAHWLERFDPADLAIARLTLRSGFGLDLTEAPIPRPAQSTPGPSEASDPTAAEPSIRLGETFEALRIRGNDWNALSPAARALLLASVLLARTPSISTGNAPRLAARISAFAMASKGPEGGLHPPASPPPPKAPERSLARPGAAARSIAGAGARHSPPELRPALPLHQIRRGGDQADAGAPAARTWEAPPPDGGLPQSEVPSQTPPPARSPPAEPFLAADAEFDSAFGGLLFLINAFVALGLYPDFTEPLGRRLDPSPLWLVDRIGRWRFGARYRRDPLAGWIAGNAARGCLPRQWRAKEEWLAGFGAAPSRRLFVGRARTTLWHPAGFPLLDGPTPGLARLARRLGPRMRVGAGRPRSRLPSRGPDRWVACLALYLEARLQLCGAGLSLLELPARVRVRDLDLHAGFRLDVHPIALRMAGLDRDPGWQPAEGRSIAFGFE
jgi:hypothetical protein